LEEQEVMVVVEKVAEAKEREESCIGASTPDEVHSTEVVAKRENETNEQLVEYGIEMDTTKEGVWTRRMSRGTPRRHGSGLIGVVISLGCPLHSLLVRSRSMWLPLVHEVEWFSGSFSPLVYSFKSK